LSCCAACKQCQTLSRAAAVYVAVKHILCSEVETDALHAAKHTLLKQSDIEALTMQYPDLCIGDMDTAGVTVLNLRKKSLFAVFFRQIAQRDDVSEMSESAAKLSINDLYSPATFKVVTDLLPYPVELRSRTMPFSDAESSQQRRRRITFQATESDDVAEQNAAASR